MTQQNQFAPERPLRLALTMTFIFSALVGVSAPFVPFHGLKIALFGVPYSAVLAFTVIGILLTGRSTLLFSGLVAALFANLFFLWILRFADNLETVGTIAKVVSITNGVAMAVCLFGGVFGWVKHFRSRKET